jgi:hypothetical protein
MDNSEQPGRDPDSSGDGSANGNQDGNGQGESINQQVTASPLSNTTGNWADAKGSFTRYAKNTRGANVRKAAKSYVRTFGGARGATKSASKGVSTGRGLVSFLGSVSAHGGSFTQTITELGLSNYIGRSPEETLAKIADTIAPIGTTNDEAIARDAVISTLDQLYSRILEQEGDITALERLTPDMIKEVVIDYVSNYIFKKWIYELGLAIEKNAVTEKEAIEMEADMKVFIKAEVNLGLKDRSISEFNLSGQTNQQLIEEIFQIAYSTLER